MDWRSTLISGLITFLLSLSRVTSSNRRKSSLTVFFSELRIFLQSPSHFPRSVVKQPFRLTEMYGFLDVASLIEFWLCLCILSIAYVANDCLPESSAYEFSMCSNFLKSGSQNAWNGKFSFIARLRAWFCSATMSCRFNCRVKWFISILMLNSLYT